MLSLFLSFLSLCLSPSAREEDSRANVNTHLDLLISYPQRSQETVESGPKIHPHHCHAYLRPRCKPLSRTITDPSTLRPIEAHRIPPFPTFVQASGTVPRSGNYFHWSRLKTTRDRTQRKRKEKNVLRSVLLSRRELYRFPGTFTREINVALAAGTRRPNGVSVDEDLAILSHPGRTEEGQRNCIIHQRHAAPFVAGSTNRALSIRRIHPHVSCRQAQRNFDPPGVLISR